MSSASTRPFRPGPLAGHGSVLWLLDVGKPVLVRRASDGSMTAHKVPGRPRGSGIVGYLPRWLHADVSGCWIVGADGVAHCDHSGRVTGIESERISASSLSDGVLATAVQGKDALTLRTLDGGAFTTVELPAEPQAINPADDGGFLVLMRTGRSVSNMSAYERGTCCARVSLNGTLTLGTAWDIHPWRDTTPSSIWVRPSHSARASETDKHWTTN